MQLQQDVQAKYPEFLSAVVAKIIPSLTQLADEDQRQRLFTNLIHLCQWSSVPETQRSARYWNLMFSIYWAVLFACLFARFLSSLCH